MHGSYSNGGASLVFFNIPSGSLGLYFQAFRHKKLNENTPALTYRPSYRDFVFDIDFAHGMKRE